MVFGDIAPFSKRRFSTDRRSSLMATSWAVPIIDQMPSSNFNGMVMDGSMQATITATILGLAAQIEREFLSLRTREALAHRKSQGLPLGRPRGQAKQVKLDIHQKEILVYLDKGVSKRSIARILDCSPSTLYSWLKRKKIRKY